jgi:hypothetical protein
MTILPFVIGVQERYVPASGALDCRITRRALAAIFLCDQLNSIIAERANDGSAGVGRPIIDNDQFKVSTTLPEYR